MKNKYSRRLFLQNAAALLAVSSNASALDFKKKKPLLSFSTLGCPDWSFEKIVKFAAENSYDGIEIRTIRRQLDLPKCEEFNTPEKISVTSRFLKDKGIKIVDLGSSASLHQRDLTERKKNLDEAKQFVDLASKLNCPFIRVFPNDFPPDQDRKETMELISNGLLEIGNYANGSGVSVLLESHGQVVKTEDLLTIMQAAEHKNVGLIWDIVNMWSVIKEPPVEVHQKLKKYIRHTHIKDLRFVDGKEAYTLLGQGETPIFEGIDVLQKGGYKGYYSFEWEKMWHPELAEPEIALANFPKKIRAHFNNT